MVGVYLFEVLGRDNPCFVEIFPRDFEVQCFFVFEFDVVGNEVSIRWLKRGYINSI